MGTDLRRAWLVGANLHRVELRNACLTRASLHGADLRGAKLVGLDLQQANLEDAVADLTNMVAGRVRPGGRQGADGQP